MFGLGQALVVGNTVVFPSISVFDLNSADATMLTLTATVSGGGTLSLGANTGQTTIPVTGTYSQITGELDGLTFTPPEGVGGVPLDGMYTVTFIVEGGTESALKTETITVSNDGTTTTITVDSTASSGLIVNAGLIDITDSSIFESVALDNANGQGTLQVEASKTLTLIQTVIKNGTVTVAPPGAGLTTGLIDVTGTSSINKASINGGGEVKVESGQKLTLDNTTVSGTTITGADATSIVQVHDTFTLTLAGGATMSGGTLSVASGATLDVEAPGSPAAMLDGVQVIDDGAIEIAVTTPLSAATLLLDDGTAVTGGGTGTLTIDSLGTLDVELGPGGVTAPDATLDGVLLTDNGAIRIAVTAPLSAATLLLDDGTTITGGGTGTVTIGGLGTLDVELGPGGVTAPDATLDGVLVTDNGAIEIAFTAPLSPAMLLLNGGTRITGGGTGTLTIGSLGTLAVKSLTGTGTPSTPDATLDDVAVTDNNIGGGAYSGIDIDSGATAAILTLDGGTSITGGTLTIGVAGTLAVETLGGSTLSSPDATLDGVAVTVNNTGGGTYGGIEIDISNSTPTAILALDGGTAISGAGTGTMTIGTAGMLAIETLGGSTLLSPDATLEGVVVTDSNATDGIDLATAGAILALDGGTQINSTDGGTVLISGGTLAIETLGGSTLSSPDATLDGIIVTDSNATDGIDITTLGAILALDGGTAINGSDSGTVLIGTAGTLAIETLGGSTLVSPDATLDGVIVTDSNATDGIDITTPGAILALDGGTQIYSNDSGTVLIGSGGELSITGAATLDGVIVTDSNATDGIDVAAVLTLDGGAAILGGGTGMLTVESSGKLILEDNAHIAGTSITNNNLVEVSGAAELSGSTLTNVVSTPGTGLQIDDGDTLTLSGETISKGIINNYNSSTVPADGGIIDVIGGSTINDGATLNYGSVMLNARLTLNGTSGAITGINHTAFTTGSGHSLRILGPVTLHGSAITDDGHVTIGSTTTPATLTVDDGTTIDGSAASGTGNGVVTINSGSALDVEKGAGPDYGATLERVIVTNHNLIEIDAAGATPATLTLDDGTSITGGTLTFGSVSDTLDIESASGATLANIDVAATGPAGAVDVAQSSSATLTLSNGMTMSGVTLTIGASTTTGLVDVETSGGAVLYDVIVDNYTGAGGGSGAIEIGVTKTGSVLTLEGNAAVHGGSLTVYAGSSLNVEGTTAPSSTATVVTLDGVNVYDNGTINVDPSQPATLVLDDGTDISGAGKLIVATTGILDIEDGSTGPDYGATLDGLIVTNHNLIEIDAAGTTPATLTLGGGTTITGGTLTFGNASDTMDVEDASGATLDNVDVSGSGTIDVATTEPTTATTLTLDGGTTVTGGTMTIGALGTVALAGGTLGTSSVTDNGALSGYGTVSANLSGGGTITASGGTLTLTGTLTGGLALQFISGGMLEISGGGTNTAGSPSP